MANKIRIALIKATLWFAGLVALLSLSGVDDPVHGTECLVAFVLSFVWLLFIAYCNDWFY